MSPEERQRWKHELTRVVVSGLQPFLPEGVPYSFHHEETVFEKILDEELLREVISKLIPAENEEFDTTKALELLRNVYFERSATEFFKFFQKEEDWSVKIRQLINSYSVLVGFVENFVGHNNHNESSDESE